MARDAGEAGGARGAAWLGWTLLFLALAGLLQLLIPAFFDGDTGYHLAVARLTREHGVLHAFPWTPFSWLAEHYADKELLFHWLLVPLAGLDPLTAARIAGTLLGGGLLLAVYALLRLEGVPAPGLWALLPLVASSAFVARFAMVRPHLLSVALVLVLTWAAARERRRLLAVSAFLFPLCYTAWHLPLVLVAIVESARFAAERRIDWRVPALTAAALGLGIAVHPNFPETARLFWIQNATILFGTAWSGAQGVDLGGEFRPFSLAGLLRYVTLPAALVLAALAAAVADRTRRTLPLAFAGAALAFLAITLRTQRFIEYLAPFAVVAAALAFAGRPAAWRLAGARALPAVAVAVGLAWTLAFGRQPFALLGARHQPFPPHVAALLGDIIPEGAQVVTCDWRLTGEMMLALPERRFLVALDPVFFALHDPERYRVWYETVREPPERPATLLRDTFDAGWVLCGEQEQWRALHAALERDPAAALRGDVGLWRVYELRPSRFDPAALSSR